MPNHAANSRQGCVVVHAFSDLIMHSLLENTKHRAVGPEAGYPGRAISGFPLSLSGQMPE
jgi:hypothetical protein